MQALSVVTTENWSACLGHYRRRGDTLLTSAADRHRTSTHYDTNGNLLNKKRYAYVPNGGTLGACLETISYGYDAAHQDWADQLTSYNGEAIRYDDSGNPISYRGYTMAWQGKRLTSAAKTGTAITYSYDENGIRTQKTINGVSTNYYYNGSVLISQVSGNDTLLFSYDANGSVVSVNFNGTDYYYVRNGQGGYYTGYEYINGSETTVGGFCSDAAITHLDGNRYLVEGSFSFNDKIDPNRDYRTDVYIIAVLRTSILNVWQGRNYDMHINGSFSYIYEYNP